MGPQVDVGRAVETLLADANEPAAPGVARVAVAQRQQFSALAGSFQTATDPENISLAGTGSQELITIAPDWTGLAPGASGVTYTLAGPSGRVLARTPWARLLPAVILASAGQSLQSASPRSVRLTYQASRAGKVAASATFTLTFSPWDGTTPSVAAPVVPAVVTGPGIPVKYDLSGLASPASPVLVVSYSGRIDPDTGASFGVAYSVPLTATIRRGRPGPGAQPPSGIVSNRIRYLIGYLGCVMEPGELLEQARVSAGLTQEELARRAGTSRTTLSAYEHGRKSPTAATLARLLSGAGWELAARPHVSFTQQASRGGKPVWVPDRLPRLDAQHVLAMVELPLHLNWSAPGRVFDLRSRADRARAYEIVLQEGRPADILAYIDGALLADLWDDLVLPRAVRSAWDPVVRAAGLAVA